MSLAGCGQQVYFQNNGFVCREQRFIPFVFLLRESATNSNLEPRERRVRPHVIEQQQKLSKDRQARLFQIVRMSSFLANIAFDASDTRLHYFVHQRREIREHV